MHILAKTSAAGIFVAGLLIFLCWIIAAHDEKLIKRKIGGCIQKFHKHVKNIEDKSLRRYYRANKDVYPYLISFGVICGLLWMGTAAAVLTNPKYYLAAGSVTTLMFICIFVPMVERIQSIRSHNNCFEDNDDYVWRERHMEDSFDMIWGSSIVCFLLSAYQIGCALALIYNEEFGSITNRKEKLQDKTSQEVLPPVIEKPNENKEVLVDTKKDPKQVTEDNISKSEDRKSVV